MDQSEEMGSLLPRHPPSARDGTPLTGKRWDAKKFGLAAGAIGGGLFLVLLWGLWQKQQAAHPQVTQPLPPAHEVTGDTQPLAQLALPTSYAGLDRRQPAPGTPPAAPPAMQPMAPMFAGLQPVGQPQGIPPMITTPPAPSPQAPAPRAQPAAPQATGKETPAKTGQHRRTFAKAEVGKPPFEEVRKAEPDPKEEKDAAASKLLTHANWAVPADKLQVVYRSQPIHGLLETAATSESPGIVRIKVTRPVQDFWQSGHVLIPQHSYILGKVDVQDSQCQKCLDLTVDQMIFPDGRIVGLEPTHVSDEAGAGGLEAHVDRHIPGKLFGAVITAVLSLGARSIGGNGGGAYQSDPALEASRSLSGQINQMGSRIVEQQFMRPDTRTLDAGEPILLFLKQNLSLSRPPKVIK